MILLRETCVVVRGLLAAAGRSGQRSLIAPRARAAAVRSRRGQAGPRRQRGIDAARGAVAPARSSQGNPGHPRSARARGPPIPTAAAPPDHGARGSQAPRAPASPPGRTRAAAAEPTARRVPAARTARRGGGSSAAGSRSLDAPSRTTTRAASPSGSSSRRRHAVRNTSAAASCASLAESARQLQYATMSELYDANRASNRRVRARSLSVIRATSTGTPRTQGSTPVHVRQARDRLTLPPIGPGQLVGLPVAAPPTVRAAQHRFEDSDVVPTGQRKNLPPLVEGPAGSAGQAPCQGQARRISEPTDVLSMADPRALAEAWAGRRRRGAAASHCAAFLLAAALTMPPTRSCSEC